MIGSIAVGFIVAFGVSLLLGAPLIRVLRRVGARQTISTDAPARHQAKQGTPTMGGLLILAGLALPMLFVVVGSPGQSSALALLGLTLAFGLIG
ncbi:MAG TPA: hypothetical protein VNJ09_00135, partial [Chthonomonadales bacterium]|nr:hypothetical protein [Chthonomonadales bacterium]